MAWPAAVLPRFMSPFSIDPYLICARQNVSTAALDLARERQAHEAGARTRATADEADAAAGAPEGRQRGRARP